MPTSGIDFSPLTVLNSTSRLISAFCSLDRPAFEYALRKDIRHYDNTSTSEGQLVLSLKVAFHVMEHFDKLLNDIHRFDKEKCDPALEVFDSGSVPILIPDDQLQSMMVSLTKIYRKQKDHGQCDNTCHHDPKKLTWWIRAALFLSNAAIGMSNLATEFYDYDNKDTESGIISRLLPEELYEETQQKSQTSATDLVQVFSIWECFMQCLLNAAIEVNKTSVDQTAVQSSCLLIMLAQSIYGNREHKLVNGQTRITQTIIAEIFARASKSSHTCMPRNVSGLKSINLFHPLVFMRMFLTCKLPGSSGNGDQSSKKFYFRAKEIVLSKYVQGLEALSTSEYRYHLGEGRGSMVSESTPSTAPMTKEEDIITCLLLRDAGVTLISKLQSSTTFRYNSDTVRSLCKLGQFPIALDYLTQAPLRTILGSDLLQYFEQKMLVLLAVNKQEEGWLAGNAYVDLFTAHYKQDTLVPEIIAQSHFEIEADGPRKLSDTMRHVASLMSHCANALKFESKRKETLVLIDWLQKAFSISTNETQHLAVKSMKQGVKIMKIKALLLLGNFDQAITLITDDLATVNEQKLSSETLFLLALAEALKSSEGVDSATTTSLIHQAKKHVRACLVACPTHLSAWTLLALLLSSQDDLDGALKIVEGELDALSTIFLPLAMLQVSLMDALGASLSQTLNCLQDISDALLLSHDDRQLKKERRDAGGMASSKDEGSSASYYYTYSYSYYAGTDGTADRDDQEFKDNTVATSENNANATNATRFRPHSKHLTIPRSVLPANLPAVTQADLDKRPLTAPDRIILAACRPCPDIPESMFPARDIITLHSPPQWLLRSVPAMTTIDAISLPLSHSLSPLLTAIWLYFEECCLFLRHELYEDAQLSMDRAFGLCQVHPLVNYGNGLVCWASAQRDSALQYWRMGVALGDTSEGHCSKALQGVSSCATWTPPELRFKVGTTEGRNSSNSSGTLPIRPYLPLVPLL